MTDKEKLAKVKAEIERQIAELTPTKEKIGIVGGVAVKRHLESILSFIDSLQEEPKKCMYSKDDYTDEDRKVLCDGCKEECKYNKSDDFTKALAECIHQAQGNAVDPMVLAETWKGELIKLAKSEEPVSVWHDAREEPEEGKDFAFVTYNGIMWARYRIEDIFIEWQNYRVQTDLDKWAYVSDLLKL